MPPPSATPPDTETTPRRSKYPKQLVTADATELQVPSSVVDPLGSRRQHGGPVRAEGFFERGWEGLAVYRARVAAYVAALPAPESPHAANRRAVLLGALASR